VANADGITLYTGETPMSGVERLGNRKMRFESARCNAQRTISSLLSPRLLTTTANAGWTTWLLTTVSRVRLPPGRFGPVAQR